jgi:hypothetical protein
MSVLAMLRADRLDFPLFVHVLGAMILVGGLVAGAAALGYARGDVRFVRLGYWSLRVGGGWIASREGWDDLPPGASKPTWLDTGTAIADVGAVVLLVALVAGGAGIYRLRHGRGAALLKATLVLSLVLLAAYVVAVWAMAGKPG